jgi:threonyl-tRNA synthetase
MRILAIHSDFVEFEVKKKAMKEAEDTAEKHRAIEECLVVFSAVEKKDEVNPEATATRFVKEVKDIAEQVGTTRIVLYPYVHLTSTPGNPGTALAVMKNAEELLRAQEFEVERAPFGWYKAFTIKCKGHPLSELSREFGPEGEEKETVSEALEKEKELESRWYILDLHGELHELESDRGSIYGFDFSSHENLGLFCQYEMAKVRAVTQEPPHVTFMRKLELVDYEPGSDPGNLRYYPKGRFIKSMIEETVNRKMHEYGAMEIEAPIMYDFEHPSLKSYLHRFPARQYTIQTPNKRVFLRFAACFGQFLMAHDMSISYKQLPLKLYELTRYSFRVEQRGELTGLRRLRAFTMPDCHAFCKDIEQAKKEMETRFKVSWELQESFGLKMPDDLEFAIRVTRDFYNENKEFVAGLVRIWGKPALIEMWEKQFFYFVLKYEWNFVDALNKASALTTDQIDVENSQRYELGYTDQDGKKKDFVLMHLSPSGAIERVMYVLLEKAYFDQQKGRKPMLPVWVSPTQVRLVPVTDAHVTFCEEVASGLEKECVRVDIDDTTESVGKRIRNAEKEWVPYILVVGDQEVESGKFVVRVRETGKQETMNQDALVKEITERTGGMPHKPLPLPKMLSKRPIFVG